MGLLNANDTGDRLETFNDLRKWKTAGKKSSDFVWCNPTDFGGDFWPGAPK